MANLLLKTAELWREGFYKKARRASCWNGPCPNPNLETLRIQNHPEALTEQYLHLLGLGQTDPTPTSASVHRIAAAASLSAAEMESELAMEFSR